jgi:hypothetical protein
VCGSLQPSKHWGQLLGRRTRTWDRPLPGMLLAALEAQILTQFQRWRLCRMRKFTLAPLTRWVLCVSFPVGPLKQEAVVKRRFSVLPVAGRAQLTLLHEPVAPGLTVLLQVFAMVFPKLSGP